MRQVVQRPFALVNEGVQVDFVDAVISPRRFDEPHLEPPGGVDPNAAASSLTRRGHGPRQARHLRARSRSRSRPGPSPAPMFFPLAFSDFGGEVDFADVIVPPRTFDASHLEPSGGVDPNASPRRVDPLAERKLSRAVVVEA